MSDDNASIIVEPEDSAKRNSRRIRAFLEFDKRAQMFDHFDPTKPMRLDYLIKEVLIHFLIWEEKEEKANRD